MDRPEVLAYDFSKLEHLNSIDLSNNNYSDECRQLEQILLDECDNIIEDISLEMGSLHKVI